MNEGGRENKGGEGEISGRNGEGGREEGREEEWKRRKE